MADLRDSLSAESIGEFGKPALYAGIAIAVFLMCLIANFPYSDALSDILAPSGLKLDYQGQHLSLPFGASLDDVKLHEVADGSILIESPKVTLAPTLTSLLLGRAGLRIHAQIFDGTIRATVRQSGDLTSLSFALNSIELARLRSLGAIGLGGTLSGDGWIQIDRAKALDGAGNLALSGQRLLVRFAPGMPGVRLDEAAGTFRMDRGVITVEKFKGHGPDFSVTAQGEIRLADPLPESTLDLRVTLNPTPEGQKHFGMLLNFLPHPPNGQPYVLHGPVRLPSIS
jgi:type II secretion system protein N